MKTHGWRTACIAVLAIAVAACGGNGATDTTTDADDDNDTQDETQGADDGEGLTIGFSQVTMQSPFYVELLEGAEAAAEADGHRFVSADANGDVNKQNNDIQDLITQGIDVLILNPVNPEAVVPSIEAAAAADIPVITVDRPVESGATAHVGRDNEAMGELVGEAVAEYLGGEDGKIIEIQGDAGGIVMMNRRDGFHRAVEGVEGIELVEGPYAEYIRANAVTAMQDLLEANSDVRVVYAHNDDMAIGALQVLDEAGRDDVVVAGVDGLMEALQGMDGGRYIATALNDPRYLGDATVQAAVAAAAGDDLPEVIDAGTALVTPDTVEDYLGDTLFAEHRPELDLD